MIMANKPTTNYMRLGAKMPRLSMPSAQDRAQHFARSLEEKQEADAKTDRSRAMKGRIENLRHHEERSLRQEIAKKRGRGR
jgi:hypothetical protein